MTIQTNLHGRLKNTSLPMNHGLMPLFEAVVNSIHSIEEQGSIQSSSKITVEIIRDGQGTLNYGEESKIAADIIGFKITDNGIGFNDFNMESFQMLDTEHKADKGCRGVGRLLWLKAFNKVEIDSVFDDGGSYKSRNFLFDSSKGVSTPNEMAVSNGMPLTNVHLQGFHKSYRKSSYKTIDSIAKSLLEHCLWYFVRDGSAPQITIKDGSEIINLNELFDDYMISSAKAEQIKIKNQIFEITHIKFRASSSKNHSISLCAANRLVKEEGLTGKIPGLTTKIGDDSGDFIYSCYISSPYLDERVHSERTGFNIAEDVEGMLSRTEISYKNIRDAIYPKIKDYLSEYLEVNIKAGKKRVQSYVDNKAPRYRSILSHIPEEKLIVDPAISDKELDLTLHKHLSEIERKILSDGHSIMTPKENEKSSEYQNRLQDYLKTAADLKKSDLANYVSHRKVILDLLEAAIQRTTDGKYVREELIHQLIMPMGKTSDEVSLDNCNLWLVDERLAFHDYLASDKTLNSMPITGNNETKEPDLCALNICDNPILFSEGKKLPLASIVVIEIKRPMRNDAKSGEEKDPIEQAIGYLNRIRDGKVKTSTGRLIPNSDDIPGYCYVICDITETVKNRCRTFDLTVTSDNLGYFGFHKAFKTYIEVISYDRLVNSAKERNRAFFDKLGLPTS